jgi:hypothetical protein
MATSFESILDTPLEDVERPMPLPQGLYRCVVEGIPRRDRSSVKGTPFIEFTLRPIEALGNVDQLDIDQAGGLNGKTFRHTFYYNEGDANSLWRLRDFLVDCGANSKSSVEDAINDVINAEVDVQITHEPSRDGKAVFAKVDRTIAAT